MRVGNHGTDVSNVKRHVEATVILDPQQHVHEVFFLVAGAGRPPRAMVLDDAVHDPAYLVAYRLQLARRAIKRTCEARRWEQVGEAEPGGQLDALIQDLQELIAEVPVPVAHHGVHRQVGDVGTEEGDDVHGLRRRR